MYGLDLTSPEKVVDWFRRALIVGLPGDMLPEVALGEVWEANAASQPVILAAIRRLLDDGDDLVRSAALAFLRLRTGAATPLLRELLANPPGWVQHPDPQEPGNLLGRRVLRWALADLARRDPSVSALCEPWVASYEADEEWLSFWLDVDPKGRALALLTDQVALGRDLRPLAASLGIVYAAFARDELLRATDILRGADEQVRRGFAAEVDRYLPPTEAALRADVHARLGV